MIKSFLIGVAVGTPIALFCLAMKEQGLVRGAFVLSALAAMLGELSTAYYFWK